MLSDSCYFIRHHPFFNPLFFSSYSIAAQVIEPSGATKLNITRVAEGTYCLNTADDKGISNYASVQITIQIGQDLVPVVGTGLVNTAVGNMPQCNGIASYGKVIWTLDKDGNPADLDFSIMVGDRFF